MTRKVLVRFFPPPPAASCCDNSAAANELLMQRVSALHQYFGDRVEIEIKNYATRADVLSAIEQLGSIFSDRDPTISVSTGNFYSFLASAAPIIAVGPQLAFMCEVPGWDALRAVIDRQFHAIEETAATR